MAKVKTFDYNCFENKPVARPYGTHMTVHSVPMLAAQFLFYLQLTKKEISSKIIL